MKTLNLTTVDMLETINILLPQKGKVNIIFDNGETLIMSVRQVIFHLIWWKVARKWGVPITSEFVVDTSMINSDTISKLGTIILDAVREIHSNYHDIVYDFNDSMNILNNFTLDQCQEYHKALSILDLVDIAEIPAIKKICNDKVLADTNLPMKEAEKYVKNNYNKLFNELKKPHPQNTLRDFIALKFVKEVAMAHIFYQIGYKTDINDTIIRYPIVGNYLDGLLNYKEFILESLSAKKSAFYNKDSLPTTEYFGRRQHILLSSIRYIYPGDCGTMVTMPRMITNKLKETVLYKNIIDNGQLISLTKKNIDQYVGKIVNFRTPMSCRYQDGICEACGGKLLSGITPNTHIGIFGAQQTTAIITQVVLSAKHFSTTNALEYAVPEEIANVLFKTRGGIYVKPNLHKKFKDTTLVFARDHVKQLMSLSEFNLSRLSSINETAFGVCHEFIFLKSNEPLGDQVNMEVNGQRPLYSKHLIKYIADHPELVTLRDDVFMLNMKEFDFTKALFKLITMNNSMVKFVANAEKLLSTDIRNYTSATTLLNDFANLVYSQVKPNVVYLEIVLRAAMIRSEYDIRTPIVTDIDDVKFATNKQGNSERSLGQLLSFQELGKAFKDPGAYLIPKLYTVFDDFINFKPRMK